jgi:4-hydroxy-tetrahydrodipicolinate reductase
MNIGIIGYGKMGRMIEAAALNRGHSVTVTVDPLLENAAPAAGDAVPPAAETARLGALPRPGDAIPGAVQKADVFIEFTRPDTAPGNIRAAAALGKPLVCGSTGWHDKLDEISAAVAEAGTALLWSSNFSLGVNLFYRIASYAAALADPFPEYDLGGCETHHNKKADSPSGTAKTLIERVLASMTRKKRVLWEPPGGRLEPDTIHYGSLRVGSVPGIHSLIFDSPADTIEIIHTARSREGFASGAVIAAEWLVSCPGPGKAAGGVRKGVFTMDDVLKDILP